MGIIIGRRTRLRGGILVLLRRFCLNLMSCRGLRMLMFDLSMVFLRSCDMDRLGVISVRGILGFFLS